jgi:hypothetical protein
MDLLFLLLFLGIKIKEKRKKRRRTTKKHKRKKGKPFPSLLKNDALSPTLPPSLKRSSSLLHRIWPSSILSNDLCWLQCLVGAHLPYKTLSQGAEPTNNQF